MPESVAETLHEYASFIGSSLDHVVVEALKLVFKKDVEFKLWRVQQRSLISPAAAPADSSAAALAPLFGERKRDGHRATEAESRET